MRIAIVSYDYPDAKRSVFPFVKQLVEEWALQGHECTVVAPNNFLKTHYIWKPSKENPGKVKVVRPNFLSVSAKLKIGKLQFTKYFHKRAVMKGLHDLPELPDAIYCHFWESAMEAYPYAKANNIPLFVASGESEIKSMTPEAPEGFADYVRGVICVSSKNRKESIELGLADESKCEVFPNAVNTRLFHLMDKKTIREKMGITSEKFVVAFVGWFNERKGILRVVDAINKCQGEAIYSFLIGSGDQDPEIDNILFKGRLMHEQIPEYLNAADVFVLPTLREGCCNAVVEAMSCGLPVISSNLPFNWDVLNDSNSIMVNPLDTTEIARAITLLRDDIGLRNRLAEGSVIKSASLTIDKRAANIIEFIKKKYSYENITR